MRGVFSSKQNFLFDLDGTLIDSVPAHAQAYIDALKPNHPELARNFVYAPYAGRPTREIFRALGLNDDAETSALTLRKQVLYREALERGEVTTFPGALELLERLRQKGARLFLVTGGNRISVERVIHLTGLRCYFETVVTADDVAHGKPAPDCYLHTMAQFHLEKPDCIVIEDGENGVVAAQRAGIDAVLVHTDLEIPGIINAHDYTKLTELLFA
jgi:HAD superfamily hydrolase (TIGR01509 family)